MDPSLCLIFYNLSPFKFIPENNFSKISHGYQCGGQVHTCNWTQKCACISHPSAPKHTHTYTHRVIVILFLPSAPVLRTTEKLRCSKEESYNKDFFCTKHSSECWGHLGWCDPEMKVKVTQSCLTLCDPVDYTVHGILQSVALPFSRRSSPQGSNPGLLHCRQILYCLSHQGNPRILEWVTYPFSRGSSQPRPIEPGSPALQGDSFPAKLPGKP